MSSVEQIQLSYINTTDSGINMILSWVRFNGTQPLYIHENSLQQYNSYYPILGYFFLIAATFFSYTFFFLCNRGVKQETYKILPGPNGNSRKYAVNHWKIIKDRTMTTASFLFLLSFTFS